MLGTLSVYNTEEHRVIKGSGIPEFLIHLVEGDPKRKGCLFLIYYNKLEVFCVCEWTDNHKDTFVDVLNLGKSLGNFGRKESSELRRRLFAPLTPEDTCKAIVGAGSDFHHNLQDEDSEETERVQRVAIGE